MRRVLRPRNFFLKRTSLDFMEIIGENFLNVNELIISRGNIWGLTAPYTNGPRFLVRMSDILRDNDDY